MSPETHAAILFAIATGIVASGFAGAVWELITGDAPEFQMLFKEDLLAPLRILVLLFSAPWLLICWAMWWFIVAPLRGFPVLAVALGWSFAEGIFLLTKVFGVA